MRFWRKPEKKENPTGKALLVNQNFNYSPPGTATEQIKEGYKKNVIVYRAIKEIATACANLSLELHKNDEYVEGGLERIAPFIKRPNPMESWDAFITGSFVDCLSTGEMFISGLTAGNKKLKEMWRQSPVHMTIKPGVNGIPAKYIFNAGKDKVEWDVDQLTGQSDMFFFKLYNPLDYWRGMSPLEAAALATDAHNAGLAWNYSLLRNGARPSGILKFKGTPGDNEISRIKELFKTRIQGQHNAGEIPMLVEEAEWQPVDNNPKDMDYINTLKETVKYIASAYGVPLPLVDNDSSTFNNMEQAKERLYVDTVIPLFNGFLSQFNTWLQQYIGPEYSIKIDMDDIPALEGVRQKRFDRMIKAVEMGVLSIDEAREEIGYDPIGADTLLVPAGRVPYDMAGISGLEEEQQETAKAMKAAGFTDKEIRSFLEADRCH